MLAERFEIMERGQSEALMPMINAVLEESELCFADLDLLATTIGPGSYTGLRICLAAARALSLAARLPVLGVTTFEAISVAQDSSDLPLLVAIDSKRADCYVQLFDDKRRAIGEPAAILPDELASLVPEKIALAGTAADKVGVKLISSGKEIIRLHGHDYPHAAQIGCLAAELAADAMPRYGEEPPKPLYLRPPDITNQQG